jgi:hypothetical protein
VGVVRLQIGRIRTDRSGARQSHRPFCDHPDEEEACSACSSRLAEQAHYSGISASVDGHGPRSFDRRHQPLGEQRGQTGEFRIAQTAGTADKDNHGLRVWEAARGQRGLKVHWLVNADAQRRAHIGSKLERLRHSRAPCGDDRPLSRRCGRS